MSKTSKRYGYKNNIATIIVIILALNLLSANGEIYILFKQVTLTLRVIYPDDTVRLPRNLSRLPSYVYQITWKLHICLGYT